MVQFKILVIPDRFERVFRFRRRLGRARDKYLSKRGREKDDSDNPPNMSHTNSGWLIAEPNMMPEINKRENQIRGM